MGEERQERALSVDITHTTCVAFGLLMLPLTNNLADANGTKH